MSVIRIGFSGSRDGMTPAQMRAVYQYLDGAQFEAHHGDCVGSDAEFHVIATVLGGRTVAHPPVNTSRRAYCKADVILPARDYLSRDWDIARDAGELIATPKDPRPPSRPGGTWTTIGYAVQLGRPVHVFLPDGTWKDGREFYGVPLPAVPGGAS